MTRRDVTSHDKTCHVMSCRVMSCHVMSCQVIYINEILSNETRSRTRTFFLREKLGPGYRVLEPWALVGLVLVLEDLAVWVVEALQMAVLGSWMWRGLRRLFGAANGLDWWLRHGLQQRLGIWCLRVGAA